MNRSAGYTLIEVLIMLAITAILAATVLETVRASTANGIRIEQAARHATQDYITLASVRRAIEASRPDYSDSANTFMGDETQFSALTSYPITSTQAGLLAYTLRFENETDGARLVYEEQDRTFTVGFWPEARASLSFYGDVPGRQDQYLHAIGSPRPKTWSPEWPIRSTVRSGQNYYGPLPLAVQARIERDGGQTEIMIFELPVTAPPRPRISDILATAPQ